MSKIQSRIHLFCLVEVFFGVSAICLLILPLANADSSQGNQSQPTPAPQGNGSIDYLAKLKTDLFGDTKKYDSKKRPVLNFKDAIEVNIFLIILHVYHLDEITGTLQVNGWAEMSWYDAHLSWNVSDYGGLDFLDIPDRILWRPDMTIMNSIEPGGMLTDASRSQIYVRNDGRVFWIPPFFSKTSCHLDHRAFPYDEQQCRIQIGSWAYPATYLQLRKAYDAYPEPQLIASLLTDNALWEFLYESSNIHNASLACCPEDPFMMLDYVMFLRRQSPFHKFLFVIPSIMAMILTLVLFWTPAADKFTIGAIVIFMQMALLLALNLVIPNGGRYVPRIVLFCGNSLIMSTVSLIVSSIVIRMSRKTSYTPLPATIKNILAGPVGRILFLDIGSFQADTNCVLSDRKLDTENGEGGVSNMAAKPSAFGDWLLLATAVDHLCFFIYTFVFAILLVVCFAV